MDPKPRDANMFNCVIIALYSSSFIFLLTTWMNANAHLYIFKIVIIWLSSLILHFLILYKRQFIYELLCKTSHRKIRFFEAPYATINGLLYVVTFWIWPITFNLFEHDLGILQLINDSNVGMYLLFSGGTIFVSAAISGLDVYPVNMFGTIKGVEHLITITKELMKSSNRLLIIAAGSILFGWAFKKVELSLTVIYLTMYGIIGFGLGTTARLGSRVTELLYVLVKLEEDNGSD